MTILTTCWQSAMGQKCVQTIQEPGESEEDFVARHLAAVRLAQAECPPL